MVMAARKSVVLSLAAVAQKFRTPASARRPLRASLITLVSIKDITGNCVIVLALEIGVHPNFRHCSQ
jgi:hypothetical protein